MGSCLLQLLAVLQEVAAGRRVRLELLNRFRVVMVDAVPDDHARWLRVAILPELLRQPEGGGAPHLVVAPVALELMLHARYLHEVLVVPVEEGLGKDGRLRLNHRRVVFGGLAAFERLFVVDVFVPLRAPREHGAVDVAGRRPDRRLRDEGLQSNH